MALTYNNDQHMQYLMLTDGIGADWVNVFDGDTDFYNAAYWDLLTRIWRSPETVRKTDALGFMTGIKSAQTAGKYIDVAIEKGLIVERDNPEDKRSKLIELSPDMRTRLDVFFDRTIGELRKTARRVDALGPSPDID